MKTLVDHVLILAGCCFLMNLTSNAKLSLLCFLIAVAVSEFEIIFDKRSVTIGLSILYLVLCMLQPSFLMFLPLILYDILWIEVYWMSIVLGCCVMVQSTNYDIRSICFLIFMLLCSTFIEMSTKKRCKQYDELIHIKDNSKELQIIMERRNHELLLNQDNEIRVATLQERNRIAREIHDNVGHMLSRSILMLGAVIVVNKDKDIKDSLTALKDTLSNAMNEIRNSVHDLHDESIDLKETILQLTKEFTFCPITLDYDMGIQVDRKVKLCFISIVKEACSNIMKHSDATNVQILMREHPGIYQLLIHDNGSCKEKQFKDGMGLNNMKERVRALNGQISITTEHGYRIFISIPKQERENMTP